MYFGAIEHLKNAFDEYEAAEDKSKTYIGQLLVQSPQADFESFIYSQAALLGYQGIK